MSLTDLLPSLQALPRADKLQAIQVLAAELMEEDKLRSAFKPDVIHPIWSPHDSYEAAAVLQKLLDAEKTAS